MERQWDESSARQVRSLLQPTNFFFEILFSPRFWLGAQYRFAEASFRRE
jgi:hypothetical protein